MSQEIRGLHTTPPSEFSMGKQVCDMNPLSKYRDFMSESETDSADVSSVELELVVSATGDVAQPPVGRKKTL